MTKNTIHHLRDKVGADTRQRNRLTEMLFGEDGLVEASDRQSYDIQLTRLHAAWPDDKSYLEKVVNQILRHSLLLKWDWLLDNLHRTNNNAECVNNVLKHMVGFTPQQLPELVVKLRALVKTQTAEVSRALVGLGDLCIAPSHAHLQISCDQWQNMTEKGKARLV
jgi:hypothetical protein